MVALATAFVRLRLDTSQVKGDVNRGLRGAGGEKAAAAKGRSISQAFAQGFEGGGSTFGRVAATMAARTTILTGALAAGTPIAAKFVAAVAPAAGVVVGLVPASVAASAASGTLKVALAGVSDTIKQGLAGNTKAYEKSLKELVPAQRTVAREVVGLRGRFREIQQVVAQRFFKPIVDDIRPLAGTFLPVARKEMGGLARQLGQFASQVLVAARTAPVVNAVRDVFRSTSQAVKSAGAEVALLIPAVARLVSSSMPILRQMSLDTRTLAVRFREWLNEAARTGRIVTVFMNARTTIGQLVTIMRNLGAVGNSVFEGMTGDSRAFLQRLVDLSARARAFVESARGMEFLRNLFATLGVLGEALRRALAGLLPQLGTSLSIAAPAGAALATSVSRLVVAFGPLLPALAQAAAVIVRTLVPGLNALAGWLERNEDVVRALAPAIVAYIVASKAAAAITAGHTIAMRAWSLAVGVAKTAQAGWTAVSWLASAPVHAHTAAIKLSRSTIGTWIGVKALETRAWLGSVANSARATAGVAAHRIAVLASTTATKASAVATTAWAAITAGSSVALATARKAVLALNLAMRANPIGAVITAITLLVGALVILYQRNETVRKIIDAVWKAIKTAVAGFVDWFTGTALPNARAALSDIGGFFQGLGRVARSVWEAITGVVRLQWQLIGAVFGAIKTAVTVTLPGWFSFMRTSVASRMNEWKNNIANTWVAIRDNTFGKLRTFITQTLPNAFTSGVNAIRAAWAKVQEAARTPVSFVVNRVINPLISGYNKVAGVFGAPKADTIAGFDRGGQIPGPRSEKDNRIATVMDAGRRMLGNLKVATGEFIVNTRSTMANLPLIEAINRARGKVRPEALDPYLDGMRTGGLVGRRRPVQGDGIGDFFGKVVSGLKGAGSFVTDPVAGLKRIANAALDRIPGAGSIVALLRSMGQKLIGGLGSFLGGAGGIGSGAAGGGSGRMMAFLRQRFPGLRLLSGFRPGSRTLSGSLSWHARDRAVDVPAIRAVAAYIRSTVGRNALELITPWRDMDLLRGRPHRYSDQVHDQHAGTGNFRGNAHIHWAARLGGLVEKLNNMPIVKLLDRGGAWPSGTLGMNRSGHTEHVLTGGPEGDVAELKEILSAILVAIRALGGEVADALERPARRAVQLGRGRGGTVATGGMA